MLLAILLLSILNSLFIIFIINEGKSFWEMLNNNKKEISLANEDALGCLQTFTQKQHEEMIDAVKKTICSFKDDVIAENEISLGFATALTEEQIKLAVKEAKRELQKQNNQQKLSRKKKAEGE